MRGVVRQAVLFTLVLLTLLQITWSASNRTNMNMPEALSEIPKGDKAEVINVGGDVSFGEELNRILWNPHCTGLTNASCWEATFRNETRILLKTASDEVGHVAVGAWWTSSFKSREKLQLCTPEALRLIASFRVNVACVKLQTGTEWLRIALVCAVQRADGSVLYTEMDFYDSPQVLLYPFGDVMSGGNVIYEGGDVVEYKIDQIALDRWTDYSIDLTEYVNSAWSLRPGDALESVYIVIEVAGCANVDLKIDDLCIAQVA